MKVIFLDIDGVLNSEQLYDKHYQEIHDGFVFEPHQNYDIDEAAVEMLNLYIEEHDLHLVISSSWRELTLKATLCYFAECKLAPLVTRIIGQTQHTYDGNRGQEIDLWIEKRPEIEEYVIIDDDDFNIYQTEHLVKTDCRVGLTKGDLEKCSKILKL